MKKALLALTFATVALSVSAQTVTFSNTGSAIGGTGAPVFNVDGSTRLDGAGYLAQLYTDNTALGAAAPFRTGAGAGFWNPGAGATVTIPGVAPGAAVSLNVRAWDASKGTSYEAALAAGGAAGQSAAISVVTGGAGSPPGLPASLTGLASFSLKAGAIPEPSTIALAAIGGAALLLRRKK